MEGHWAIHIRDELPYSRDASAERISSTLTLSLLAQLFPASRASRARATRHGSGVPARRRGLGG